MSDNNVNVASFTADSVKVNYLLNAPVISIKDIDSEYDPAFS